MTSMTPGERAAISAAPTRILVRPIAAVSAMDEPNIIVVTPAQTASPVHMGQGSQVEMSSEPVRSGLPQRSTASQDGGVLGVQAGVASGHGCVVGPGKDAVAHDQQTAVALVAFGLGEERLLDGIAHEAFYVDAHDLLAAMSRRGAGWQHSRARSGGAGSSRLRKVCTGLSETARHTCLVSSPSIVQASRVGHGSWDSQTMRSGPSSATRICSGPRAM